MQPPPRRHAPLAGMVAAAIAAAACGTFRTGPLRAVERDEPELAAGWDDPPVESRIRAYWWWLNGNVTRAAITRDLEEMRARGFGGALICDAGGAEQDGNDRVRPGPAFLSPEWRELYRHALREADRLGLVMSLNIQSGWNLGGPPVRVEDAAKKLVWSEARLEGPGRPPKPLPRPPERDGFYRDLFVVAWPLPAAPKGDERLVGLRASSAQGGHPAELVGDGDEETFWVSAGEQPGEGPTAERPQWIELEFREPVEARSLGLTGRPGYGPRACELHASDDGERWRRVAAFEGSAREPVETRFEPVRARRFRVVFPSAFDPRSPDRPRNVQVAELVLAGPDGAWPRGPRRRPIELWQEKAVHRALHFSAPDTTPLLRDLPDAPGEEDARSADVVDLSARLAPDGTLDWQVPAGRWQVLRFGATVGDHARVSTSSDGWKGYALDPLDAGAFLRYWDAVVEPLIEDAGGLAGRSLRYLHTDSWEVEAVNWTPTLREEFRRRRGYDLVPFLPVLAGRIVDRRSTSNRFLDDFRRTLGDLAVDNHFRPFREGAHRHGLRIHPESGGPHAVPIDAQQCLGANDVPMSEFWAWSWRHRIGDQNRFFVKQPASAAHTNGRRLVAAEGFTTIGPHWQETIWDNLKPAFDKALCEGLNLLVWHAVVCSPEEEGLPGIQYFAGTHFNPGTTWWSRSGPFLACLNRCQWMLSRGLFVADACYYYGDHVPNFAGRKATDPARVLPGRDYDVIAEEALVTRLSTRDGRLLLPDGMSYRVLVLPDRPAISLRALRRLRELVEAGATVIGTKPSRASGLSGLPESDAEVARLARELWGDDPADRGDRRVGKGRVAWGRTAGEVLLSDGVPPDLAWEGAPADADLDFIHRRDGETDIYFLANRAPRPESVSPRFRVEGKAPELWDPVSGRRSAATWWESAGGTTRVPLDLSPCGSVFVVFRRPAAPPATRPPRRELVPVADVRGPWTVRFDPRWGGPAESRFDELESWTEREEPGIRWYSGTATYETTFDLPGDMEAGRELFLDLGRVKELAEVRLNGKPLGIVWAPPFRVEISPAVAPAGNRLEVDIVSFWPNRIIGDAALPPERRVTRTNIRKLTAETPLVESGLLGPVRILSRT